MFRPSFKDRLISLCSFKFCECKQNNLFLYCHFCRATHATLISDFEDTDYMFYALSYSDLMDLILFGSDIFCDENTSVS